MQYICIVEGPEAEARLTIPPPGFRNEAFFTPGYAHDDQFLN